MHGGIALPANARVSEGQAGDGISFAIFVRGPKDSDRFVREGMALDLPAASASTTGRRGEEEPSTPGNRSLACL